MGIVLKQSFKNTIIIYLAFLIGGVNTIIFYPEFLGSKFYGLVVYLLSTDEATWINGTIINVDGGEQIA